jgi:hypothetical protein
MQQPSVSSVQTISFDQTVAAEAPTLVKTISSPLPPGSLGQESNRRPAIQSLSMISELSTGASERSPVGEQHKAGNLSRPATSGANTNKTPTTGIEESPQTLGKVPSIVVDDSASRPNSRRSERKWGILRTKKSSESIRRPKPVVQETPSFHGITLNIPSITLEDLNVDMVQLPQAEEGTDQKFLTSAPSVTVSSVFTSASAQTEPVRQRTPSSLRIRQSMCSARAISADEDMLSRRVRLMYEKGEENVSDLEVTRAMAQEHGILWEEPSTTDGVAAKPLCEPNNLTKDLRSAGTIRREEQELAGGIEDWKNVEAADVDRYGFIHYRTAKEGSDPSALNPLQRVSTSLLIASETPRRRRTVKRSPSMNKSSLSLRSKSPTRSTTDVSINRPTSSQSAYRNNARRQPSRLRYATNVLPHNRNRRLRDNASDMLTLPYEIPETNEDSPAILAMKRKEWEREDKWMKMAKPIKKNQDGSGMTFEFDTTSSKLIERTWKGIPDSWRATAWYAFLDASARRIPDSPTAKELIEAFHDFQDISSPDDVQIDIDVPRTINSHIMFRRRYRGGQRLLFRVLHAMSLYFPETGYVQGMAALAATLLAYYDEENAFLMLARLWKLRGLEQLYKEGFSGLMDALNDFEKGWLEGGEVAGKLVCFQANPTVTEMHAK